MKSQLQKTLKSSLIFTGLLILIMGFQNCGKKSEDPNSAQSNLSSSNETDTDDAKAVVGRTSCRIEINEAEPHKCFSLAISAGVRNAGAFVLHDDYQDSATDAFRCVKRAQEYRDWCNGNGYPVVGVAATYYVGGRRVIQGASNSGDGNFYVGNGYNWNSYIIGSIK